MSLHWCLRKSGSPSNHGIALGMDDTAISEYGSWMRLDVSKKNETCMRLRSAQLRITEAPESSILRARMLDVNKLQ
jgi:hypothetical protein